MAYREVIGLIIIALTSNALLDSNVAAQNEESDQVIALKPAQLFAFADAAYEAGDFETAEAAYRALASNPDVELRTEARFRLALMLADGQQRYREAAVLLREILDEKPSVARVRVELARMQAALGNYTSAERELRAAQATGLPREVEQLVKFYASALSARKRIGGSIQLAFAPDTNINRATNSDTLGTVIGDFTLDEDAQAKSGVGLSLRAQGYFRQSLEPGIELLLRANALGRFYREGEFDDYVVSLQAGPEYQSGADQLSLAGLLSWRWFGHDPYSFGYGASANYRHPLGQRARLTVDAAAIRTEDRRNSLRNDHRFSLSAGVDRTFSSVFGGGVRVSGNRQIASDPGYSTVTGGIDAYLFRELGQTTLVANAGYDRLEADQRLFLYPERRVDDRFEVGLSGTFRALRIGALAPLATIRYEKSHSTITIYEYDRITAELGITAAF